MSKNEKTYLDNKLEKLNENIDITEEFKRVTRYKFMEKMTELDSKKTKKSWFLKVGLPTIATLLFLSVASVLLLSNYDNPNLDTSVESASLPEEFELDFEPLEYEQYEKPSGIRYEDSEYETMINDIDGEPVYLERYLQYENNKYIGIRGVIRYQEKAVDLGIITTSKEKSSESIMMFKSTFSEGNIIQFIGVVGTRKDGYQFLFYNKGNDTFFGFHHMGEADHFDWDQDGLDEIYITTSGGEKNVEVVRWNNGQLEKASINESISIDNPLETNISSQFILDNIVVVEVEINDEKEQQMYGFDVGDKTFKAYKKINDRPAYAQIRWNNTTYKISGEMVNSRWIGEEIGEINRYVSESELERDGDAAIIKRDFASLIHKKIYELEKYDSSLVIAIEVDEYYYFAFATDE
ncbi:hypothetical protein [Ornithinibacillus halotolerans]|uniref:Uncharacterized protein n=1 Tax=Ornithinibacillus halotolerans TaxID=1274357 RepID=A0A916W6Z7_9BACI|nr:hypothetical protein [Ornithinibacillus halotolerans]GGA72432.1 hypothetical protein GCM10008025_15280 [Ornithinibacillus halotolerans]